MDFRDIKGQEGKYQVSETGIIKGLQRTTRFGTRYKTYPERICNPHLSKIGYYVIHFGNKERKYLHRIIAESFIPNPEMKPQVNHKNGIKTDNRIENLEWVTCKENIIHAFKTNLKKGVSRFGNENASCKIDFANVETIKKEKGTKLSLTAKKFNISISHVWAIQNNKSRQIK